MLCMAEVKLQLLWRRWSPEAMATRRKCYTNDLMPPLWESSTLTYLYNYWLFDPEDVEKVSNHLHKMTQQFLSDL